MTPEERDRLTRVEMQFSALEEQYRELRSDVREIKEILTQAKGGWRVLMIIGGAGAMVGGLLLKLADKYWS